MLTQGYVFVFLLDMRERGRARKEREERGRVRGGGERKAEKNTDQPPPACAPPREPGIKPATWLCALTQDQTYNLLVHRRTLHSNEPPGQGKDVLNIPFPFHDSESSAW